VIDADMRRLLKAGVGVGDLGGCVVEVVYRCIFSR
jgi:hypothetical protein